VRRAVRRQQPKRKTIWLSIVAAKLGRATDGPSRSRAARSCELVWLVPWDLCHCMSGLRESLAQLPPTSTSASGAPTLTRLVLKRQLETCVHTSTQEPGVAAAPLPCCLGSFVGATLQRALFVLQRKGERGGSRARDLVSPCLRTNTRLLCGAGGPSTERICGITTLQYWSLKHNTVRNRC